ncbi:MAG: hypothetical protein IKC74_00005, partial [Clostridia bacterium]|nr:hypothetical protein [Clostridia bacterium]
TIKESYASLKNEENIIIYPEDSTNGYLAELKGFHAGFTMLCEYCKRKGYDVPIYVTYFKKEENVYIIDKPVLYSEISKCTESKEEIAKMLCDRCNELGKMDISAISSKETVEETTEEYEAPEKAEATETV